MSLQLRSLSTARKLRKNNTAAVQSAVFGKLISKLAQTSFWRERGVETGMSYDTFRTRVPLHTHEQLAPAIARMTQGEADVLWPGRCSLFAITAGTSTGLRRHVPMTDALLAHMRQAGLESLLYYTARAGHSGVFRGRHLLFAGSTALTPIAGANSGHAFSGEASGIAALSFAPAIEKHFYEPGASVAQIAEWQPRLDALITRATTQNISLIAGVPQWTILLANALRERASSGKRRASTLQFVWPNLECFVHSGAPIAPYQAELRAAMGPNVKFHEVYAASEGVVAVQDQQPIQGLRVVADAGLFFEFLPMADYDESRLEQLGPKCVPLSGVQPGVDYAILLTTPGGLARYVLGDVVRFVSTAPARLMYLGQTQLRLDAFGEGVNEKELTDSLVAVCQRRNWTIVNFHVAPLFNASSMTGQQRGRHEWWIELKPGTVSTPTGPQMAAELDTELQRLNETYAMKRKIGIMDAPIGRLVMPGVFEHWLRYQESWGGQHKMPRCRMDRQVADDLGQITHFARD